MFFGYLRNVHISWCIAACCVGVLIGIIAILHLNYQFWLGLEWLALGALLLSVGVIRRTRMTFLLFVISGILFGLFAGAHAQARQASFQALTGQTVTVNGVVADDTTRGTSGDQRLRLRVASVNHQTINGTIWTSISTPLEIKRGDQIIISGEVSEGFGAMQAALFQAELVDIQRPVPGDVTRIARDRFSDTVSKVINEPEATLGVSFLVGQRSALPDYMQDIFRDLGLVHLVVASGFHLTIVIRFVRKLLEKQSKYLATATSFVFISSFLLLTGFSTSMVRASLVAGLSIASWYYGRSIHPVVLLLVVAASTVLINPMYLWGDMAWHLSFAAFTGVIILAPLLHAYFWGSHKEPGYIRHIIIATTAAQITTMPIIALSFEQYSPIAIIANLLILPLVPLVMLGVFVVGLASFLLPWSLTLIHLPVQWSLNYITAMTEYLASLPWAVQSIDINIVHVYIYYAALLAFIIYLQRATRLALKQQNPIE